MMDAELRGALLTICYQRRHNAGGWVPLTTTEFGGDQSVSPPQISSACEHLADAGLLVWKPLHRGNEGGITGMAKITGAGIDVVTGDRVSKINVRFPNDGQNASIGDPDLAAVECETALNVAMYRPQAIKAVYKAIENLVASGKRANSHTVPPAARTILLRDGAGRISQADASAQIKTAISVLVRDCKIEAYLEPYKDWLIKDQEEPAMSYRRDSNLIRELMLRLETILRPGATTVLVGNDAEVAVDGYSAEQISHHLSMLVQMGYVDPAGSQPAFGVALKGISPRGYDYIDKNRGEKKMAVPDEKDQLSRKVFVVHGRDENAKNELALFLRRIGLEDVILHNKPNRGRHLLTKFQEEAEGASFAVILMTGDDEGGLVGNTQQRRARQNVVFELGFFIGKLGTPRVAALLVPGVEKPSDFDGICWIEFGPGTNWKNELARELSDAGLPVDTQALLRA